MIDGNNLLICTVYNFLFLESQPKVPWELVNTTMSPSEKPIAKFISYTTIPLFMYFMLS